MTISSDTRTAGPFTGTGAVSTYAFAFKVFASSEVVATSTNTSGALTTLTQPTDYTVTLNGNQNTSPGGTITLVAPLASGYVLEIGSEIAATQGASLPNQGGWYPSVIEDALDRLTILAQQMGGGNSDRNLRVPELGGIADLPSAADRAGRLVSFNIVTGDVETVVPSAQSAAALAVLLAGTGSGQGASQIGVQDAASWFSAVVTKTVETVLAWIGSWIGDQPVNVFQYMTTAQIASVKAYNFSIDVTAAVQAALAAAWAGHRDLYCPAGGYKIDAASLVLPGNFIVTDERDQALRLYGQSYGNPFSTLNGGGTVFKSVSARPILTDIALTVPNAQGSFEIDHIRFDGTSTTPVVLLNTMYGQGSFHHNSIYQRGTGDGFYLGYAATVEIHNNYFVNKDFATAVIGASRTGVGFNFPSGAGAGLVSIRKCSSRGWHDCYVIGGTGSAQVFQAKLADFECSTFYNGVTLTSKTSNCAVTNGYFEGADGGTAIADAGIFNSIVHNEIFAGFAIGIDLQAGSGYGTVCAWNEIASAALPNVTMINVVGNTGLGRSVVDNTIVWGSSGGSIAGVAGIKIGGANPQINLAGNMFSPKINWVGGAGSAQIVDNSTSTLSAGNGVYGLGTASFDNLQVPMLNQGAISLAKGATNITDVTPSGASGACTLTSASSHVIAFAGAKAITSFTAPNIEGKFFVVRVTNGNCTFTNSASLKMAGGVNYTPGANGSSVTFLMHSNVAWEIMRTAY